MDEESSSAQNLTALLHAWRAGQPGAYGQLIAVVYPRLWSLASRCMRGRQGSETLNATSLVHEAYLKILGSAEMPWQDRVHFFAVSARVMRQILVDHARSNKREKRGGAAAKISLEDAAVISPAPEERLLDLDEALKNLAEIDKRKAELVELLYFGGLSQAEAAEALQISEATVQRDIKMARAWLYRALSEPSEKAQAAGAKSV
ncbi:MAG: ECF-type sigma factor [Bryobacteraceae bacterium]